MPLSSRNVVQATVALLAVGFLTLLGIVAMTIWLNERARIYFDEVVAARDLRTAAVELRSALQAAESSQRGFLFTDNEIYLAPFDATKAAAQRQLERLRVLMAPEPQTQPMLDRLSAIVADKVTEMDRSIALKTDRRDAEVMALVRTNRGKALMDEANVFLSGIIDTADQRLVVGSDEQRTNAARLRWISIAGGMLIVLVVGGALLTVARYTREVAAARDEVRALNAGLEDRVRVRTADLDQARSRAEMMLSEVNHRVANSLAMVSSLVKLQGNALKDRAAKEALDETYARIFAIASVHKRLYSSTDVRFVALEEYLPGVLDQLALSMRSEGSGAWLRHEIAPVKLRTDSSVNLGVVVTEWVTNTFKYAYPGRSGEVRVLLRPLDGNRAELIVEDDGVGRRADAPAQGTGLGSRLVTAMAGTMQAEIDYSDRNPGTKARLVFPLLVA